MLDRVSTAISTAISTDTSVDITHSKQDPKTYSHVFKFSIHLSVRNSREKLQTNIWKI